MANSGILIYGNPTLTANLDHLHRFLLALIEAAAPGSIAVEQEYLAFLQATFPDIAPSLRQLSHSPADAMIALSIGGDGTFLTTANRIAPHSTPIMGINAGHLGYLSATDIALADSVAARIVTGDFTTESRTLIAVESDSLLLPDRPWALNEVAFLKQDTASMITVETWVNERFLASYSGDGLIVSTPTGSTGYNLSVGGPIISPRSADWVISPIAPHSLSMRPLVIPDSATLRITTRSRSQSMMLAIDGRSTPLPVETSFTLAKAPFTISVAHLTDLSFAETLRHKLHWG